MKKILFLVVILAFSTGIHAQKLVGVGKLIAGGVSDGEKLLGAYIKPLNRAMIVGLNNSGFNGAYDTDDDYRFSLSLNMSLISIPNKYKSFDVNQLGLGSVEAKDSKNPIAQTAFGDSSSIKLVSKYGLGSLRYFSFNTTEGSERNALPLPYLNGTLKLKNLTIGAQIIPPVILPKTDVRAWLVGVNVQQNIAGLLPFLESLPFDLHAGGGIFVFNAHSDLDVKPDAVKVNVPVTNDTKGPYDNQELKITYTGFYATAYASANLSIFTPFVGVGFNSGVSTFDVDGTYPIYAKTPGSFAGVRAEDIEDPIHSTDGYARVKIEAGGRFDFGRFFGQASYTLADFGGLGGSFGVRF